MELANEPRNHTGQNRFFFNLTAILGYPIHLVVHGWQSEQPLHWFSHNSTDVVAQGRFLEAPGLPVFTLDDEEGNGLLEQIPVDVAGVARLMPAMDFELCQACAISDEARQLAMDAPLLFILLVDFARKQSLSVMEFQDILFLKRTNILHKIGLPQSKSLGRLVRRISLSPMLPWELEDVTKALTNPELLALLRHHPNLHLNHLRLLLRLRHPVEPGILSIVDGYSSTQDIQWVCRMVRDSLNMARRNERVLSGVTSHQALQQLHDRLVERFNRDSGKDPEAQRAAHAEELAQEQGDYPSPPVAAIEGIEPLTSWLELLEEGSMMHHCVGSYDIPVALGEVFVYRMVNPERLTIALEYRNNRWVVGEVRGHCNANPSPGALDIVRRWVG